MRHSDSQASALLRLVLVLLCAFLLSAEISEAKCAWSFVEILGSVHDSSGAPIEGATIIAFVDSDPSPLFDLRSSEEVTRADEAGHFSLHGTFIDYAWPRWWHRLSPMSDQCGRDPRDFTLVVQADGYSATRTLIEAKNGGFKKVEPGKYVLTLADPITLWRKRSAA